LVNTKLGQGQNIYFLKIPKSIVALKLIIFNL